MDNGLVSVIIPVYNAAEYLNNILEDVVSQTYQNIEIIIINDGSTDTSATIIERYAKLDNRIISITIENSGPSKARNTGLDIAKGEFIRFIDADDRILPNSIQEMVSIYLDNEKIDLVIGNFIGKPDKGYYTGSVLENKILSQKEFLDFVLDNIKTFYVGVPWNKLYRRSLLEKFCIRFDESVSWCEDYLFNLKYYEVISNIYTLNISDGVYQYCIRKEGLTSGVSDNIQEIKRVEEKRYKETRDFFSKFNMEYKFSQQWEYIGLYRKLTSLTKYYSSGVRERFSKFISALQGEGVYNYVEERCIKTNSIEWKVLKRAIEKDGYVLAFLCFSLNGILYKVFPKWETYKRKRNLAL